MRNEAGYDMSKDEIMFRLSFLAECFSKYVHRPPDFIENADAAAGERVFIGTTLSGKARYCVFYPSGFHTIQETREPR